MINFKSYNVLVVFIMIFSLSIGVIVYKIDPYSFEPKEDSRQYHVFAKNLVENRILSLDTEAPFKPSARRTPGYPLFITLIYSLFGINVSLVKLFQIIFGPTVCLFVYFTGKYAMNNPKAGLWAAFILSFIPAFNTINNRLMPEGLFTLALLSCTYICFVWREKQTVKLAIAAGILMGIIGLIKPEGALLCVPVILSIIITSKYKKKMFQQSMIAILFTALMITPWIYRNYMVYGKACLISGQGEGEGRGMLTAYRIKAEQGVLFRPERFKYLYGEKWKEAQKRYENAVSVDVMNPEESDIMFFAKRPIVFLKFCLVKFAGFFRPSSYSETFGISDDFSECLKKEHYVKFSIKAVMLLLDILIIIAGFTGFLLSLLWRNRHLWVISSIIAYFTGVYIILHGIPRYRAPLIPLFVILGVWWVIVLFSRKSVQR